LDDRTSQNTLSDLLAQAPFPLLMVANGNDHVTRRVLAMSPGFTESFGYSPQDLVTLADVWSILAADADEHARAGELASSGPDPGRRGGRATVTSTTLRCRSGQLRQVEVHAGEAGANTLLAFEPNPLAHYAGQQSDAARPVSVRAADEVASAALRDSEEKLRIAVAASGMGLWEWDLLADTVHWDDTMVAIWGVTRQTIPSDRHAYMATIHPDDRLLVGEAIGQALATGTYASLEHRLLRPDGGQRRVVARASVLRDERDRVIKLIGGALDVTDERELEARHQEAQHLEAIGRLSAGMAHNFNNVLTAILPNLELALPEVDASAAEFLQTAREAALHAAGLVRQLVSLAGRGERGKRQAQDVRPIVERTVALCRQTFDRRITITVKSSPDELLVELNDSEFEHVLVNLLLNARDAVTHAGQAAPRVQVSVLQNQAEVIVRVADNGTGMDTATRAKAFEPFFTTKDNHLGAGLGLSTSRTIVNELHGAIECYSAPEAGTRIDVRLPLAAQSA
jgi:PAS domain S-box-containing protein